MFTQQKKTHPQITDQSKTRNRHIVHLTEEREAKDTEEIYILETENYKKQLEGNMGGNEKKLAEYWHSFCVSIQKARFSDGHYHHLSATNCSPSFLHLNMPSALILYIEPDTQLFPCFRPLSGF